MRKQLLFGAAILLAMVGCSKEELETNDVSMGVNNREIGFTTYANMNRANPIDDNAEFLEEGRNFRIAAFLGEAQILGNGNVGEKVTYSSSIWDYVNTAYWPSDGSTINFIAHYPSDISFTTLGGSVAIDSTQMRFINFSVPKDPEAHVDLMYAVAPKQVYSAVNNGKVTMAFKHALVAVVFKVKNQLIDPMGLFTISVKSITLKGIKDVATATIPTRKAAEISWSNYSQISLLDYAFDLTEPLTVPNDGAVLDFPSTTEAFLLIPQNFGEKEIVIEYTIKHTGTDVYIAGSKDKDGKITYATKTVTTSKCSDTPAGCKLTYTLCFTGKDLLEIIIGAEAAEWTDCTNSEVLGCDKITETPVQDETQIPEEGGIPHVSN